MSDQSFQAALAQRAGDAGLRQAAALIHALAPADRRWAIAQLPTFQREAVEALLDELTAMGLPRERAIVDEALHREAASAVAAVDVAVDVVVDAARPAERAAVRADEESTSPDVAAAIDRWVSAQGASALMRAIAGEPVALLARLLSVRDWSWRAEALRHLQPAVRQDVVDAMRQRADVDAVFTSADALLLGLLAQRLGATHPVSAKTSGMSTTGDTGGVSVLSRLLSRWRMGRSGR